MQFLTLLSTCFFTLISLGASSPVLEQRQSRTITPPDKYYLRTKVVGSNRDRGTNKNNLYVYSYHTGAGTGDAALSSNKTWAMEAYLNGTQQLFTYEGNTIGGWPLAVEYGSYQIFSTVTISIAAEPQYYQGFFFNSTGLQYNNTVGGWLACDWWHGVPQLFNINGYSYGALPKTCSEVNLLPVAV